MDSRGQSPGPTALVMMMRCENVWCQSTGVVHRFYSVETPVAKLRFELEVLGVSCLWAEPGCTPLRVRACLGVTFASAALTR